MVGKAGPFRFDRSLFMEWAREERTLASLQRNETLFLGLGFWWSLMKLINSPHLKLKSPPTDPDLTCFGAVRVEEWKTFKIQKQVHNVWFNAIASAWRSSNLIFYLASYKFILYINAGRYSAMRVLGMPHYNKKILKFFNF